MSPIPSKVRAMNDGRRRRRAKQARRDARRTKTHDQEPPEEAPLVDGLRQALASGHPLDLLGLASLLIQATKPDPIAQLRSRERTPLRLEDLVAGFIGTRIPETTALLAVLAELLVDDDDLRVRCRREVAARNDSPGWIADLPNIEVYRAVRMTHVLGDGDELLIGARFADGHELTCAVFIDHTTMSEVKDAFFVPDSIDKVLALAAERNTDPDTSFGEMGLADARAWVHHGLELPLPVLDTDSWPGCRALVAWLIGQLPEGGAKYSRPEWDSEPISTLLERFFVSVSGKPFNNFDDRELLLELLDTGTGDPLRWSVARIEQALNGTACYEDRLPLESVLDVPDLLRAFIPFAHAQSGIREELNAEALAAIDQLGPGFRREVLHNAKGWGYGEDS
jgi:hypothetical protein